jgi:23S rRNA (uracil1939-C5)-methyltransferase
MSVDVPMTAELDIAGLGAQGDGIARTADGLRYVPFALPGERVRPAADGLPEIVSHLSAERVRPVCRHFGTCGGCAAQHMSGRLYAEWKRGILAEALRRHGLEPEVAPLRRLEPGTRRRAVLTAEAEEGGGIRLGYHRRRSTEVIGIAECPILAPAIVAALPALRAIAAALPARKTRATVLLTRGGLDVALDTGAARIDAGVRAALGRIAAAHRLARVSLAGETLIELAPPALSCGGVDVVPPPGGFVQAAEPAELEIAAAVTEAVAAARRVADLFCGAGTWTFPIARRARVLAIDGDPAALAALGTAARRAQGLKPIETLRRDLFREPLSAKELEGFDAVVFDPPRAGARAQAEGLARSRVPVVVAVSCNPGTLARDLGILAGGGYAITSVTPIDQFLFSAHVEAVAVLRRVR